MKLRACLCEEHHNLAALSSDMASGCNSMQTIALLACSLVETAAQGSVTQRTCVVSTMVGVKELATAPMANLSAHVGEDPT